MMIQSSGIIKKSLGLTWFIREVVQEVKPNKRRSSEARIRDYLGSIRKDEKSMNEIPTELKNATNAYVDALQKYDVLTRLRVLTSVITAEIARKEPAVRDMLATHVIVGMMMVLKRVELIQQIAKKTVANLLKDLEQVRNSQDFLN